MICLTIAKVSIGLRWEDADLRPAAAGARHAFLAEGDNPDAVVRAQWADRPLDAAGEPVFDAGGLWKLFRANGDHLFRFASPLSNPFPYKTARFTPDFSRGEIRMDRSLRAPGRAFDLLEYPLDEILLVCLLAAGRGLEVHALGLADAAGRGLLFVGQSGAGKSTMAALWEGRTGVNILSDDRIVLRPGPGGIWMYGTPWHGERRHALPDGVPLDRVFFLRRGPDRLAGKRSGTSAAELMACGFLPFHSREGIEFSLALAGRIAGEVPCLDLFFTPGPAVVDLVESSLG